ncbi:iron-siderophore ABC transporter substrate-binding protein [Paraneptunicella aestuarii]|uniref:ABC transporter substrate-binding protein n=1 Tax=Paraneptunicella aestuarii TaxID=2831148 RepID=UPI001E47DB8A|nr:iron-siderophore ABC transporter substrate-binding protein [Paraneptunicella aestuarii]UAA37367.1 iron-siderophore ABC transporter substrate-binding protein [Paraneptunicella aestuarii]
MKTIAAQNEKVCLSTCVTYSTPAKRVVALNWSATEMLLSLGITPIGVAQGNGYRKWQSNHPELPDTVAEVGRRQEPDLVTIAQLKPDLIIGYDFRHARLHSALSKIAPTLLYQQFPRPEQTNFRYYDAIPHIFISIAQVTGTQEQAKNKLESMKQQLAQWRSDIAAAELGNHPVTYGKFVGMGYGLRVFGQQSLAGSIAKELGLNYQWHSVLPGKDFTHLQLEQMGEFSNTHLILADNQTNNERMIASPVWSQLAFVKNHQISETPALWSFGGPDSVMRMAQAFTESLLEWKAALERKEKAL